MKFWTLSIAALVLVGAASATPMNSSDKSKDKDMSKGHQCVPEPLTMLALAPGIAMFIKRRKKA